jgi:hypothetical protein
MLKKRPKKNGPRKNGPRKNGPRNESLSIVNVRKVTFLIPAKTPHL